MLDQATLSSCSSREEVNEHHLDAGAKGCEQCSADAHRRAADQHGLTPERMQPTCFPMMREPRSDRKICG